jgi:hypothetical protein
VTFSSDDKGIFEREVSRAFSALATNGFAQTPVQVKHGAVVGDFLETTLVNEVLNRRVRVYLLRGDQREAVTVFVEKLDKGTFALGSFLKWKGASSGRLKQTHLSTYKGSLPERLAGCLGFASTLFDNDLSSVLQGKSWPDVPIDLG